MFGKLTLLSYNRCAEAVRGFEGVIARWRAEQGQFQQPLADIYVEMPVPHAVLCVAGKWGSWAFPFASGRRAAGMGLHFVNTLWGGLGLAGQPDEAAPEPEPFTPWDLQDAADVLRRVLAEGCPDGAEDTIRYHIH